MKAGIPDGVLNVVTGLGSHAGAAISSHMDIDAVISGFLLKCWFAYACEDFEKVSKPTSLSHLCVLASAIKSSCPCMYLL